MIEPLNFGKGWFAAVFDDEGFFFPDMSLHRWYGRHVKAILVLILFGVWGCGIKGPPVPPDYATPPALADLAYVLSENQVVLTWTIPPKNAADTFTIDGVKVFRLKQPLNKIPCGDCPRTFMMIAKIPARSGTMTFQDTIDNDFDYYYKIVLYDTRNRDGKESNIVRVGNDRR